MPPGTAWRSSFSALLIFGPHAGLRPAVALATAPISAGEAACSWGRTNALGVLLPASTASATCEVQLCPLAPGAESCESVRAHTFERDTGHPLNATLHDLEPATTYLLRLRVLLGDRWSALSAPAPCRTADLLDTDVSHVQLVSEPSAHGMTISWRPPRAAGVVSYIVQLRGLNTPAPLPPTRSLSLGAAAGGVLEGRATFADLAAGSSYEIRIRADFKDPRTLGRLSDPVVYRTRTPGVVPRRLVRISELCGAHCQPDYVRERNSGDLRADVGFVTEVTGKGSRHPFDIDFPHAVLTQYCIEHADSPFRDYLSCNPRKPHPRRTGADPNAPAEPPATVSGSDPVPGPGLTIGSSSERALPHQLPHGADAAAAPPLWHGAQGLDWGSEREDPSERVDPSEREDPSPAEDLAYECGCDVYIDRIIARSGMPTRPVLFDCARASGAAPARPPVETRRLPLRLASWTHPRPFLDSSAPVPGLISARSSSLPTVPRTPPRAR
jgi:hypothetical protein